MTSIVRDMVLCDDCSLVPYDLRIGVVNEWDYDDLDEFDEAEAKGLKEQIALMVTMGNELPDHACTLTEDPDAYPKYGIMCDCACNKNRFKQAQEWAKKQRVKEDSIEN